MKDLIARLEQAEGLDRELDADIAAFVLGGEIVWKQTNLTMEQYPVRRYASTMHVGGFGAEPVMHYTTSYDAAVTLLPEDKDWSLTRIRSEYIYEAIFYPVDFWYDEGRIVVEAATAPLAICRVALLARQVDETP